MGGKLLALIIDKKEYKSRLIIGSGKYKDFEETKAALEASGAEMITVALKRTNLGQDDKQKNLLDYINPKNIIFYYYFYQLVHLLQLFFSAKIITT